ncbi:hypothetical protein DB30_03323 [Enhygromyxa salina]|uniref:Uncharacterized protein n=1 Tax=Enhygromyxa salina TaxID=215803 RepID=A0A0C1ZIN8_9BACT|nr:protein-disulfide reductase DsbD family protein [Enhygromyxa salina]KIG17404.1 hypothetical protein DB30_03323 [Enhygromyxa salina]
MSKSKLFRVCSSLSLFALVGVMLPACASNAGDGAAKGKDGDSKQAANPTAKPEGDPAAVEGQPVDGDQKVGTAAGDAAGDNKQYALQIDPAEGKVGEEGQVSIRVIPSETWHMNLEYPTKLQVTAPAGVVVAKPKLGKDDAVKFDEENCEFAVKFTPSEAGDKTFTGELKFAVCQDTACVPKTETLEFQVAVK